MNALHYIIVETDRAYNNEVNLGGVDITVNTGFEKVEYINRRAEVISAPKGTILRKGDDVIVHHNIFRMRNGIKGVEVQSNYHIEDNTYFVPPTEVFLYKSGEMDDWEAVDPFCFIRPIEKEKNRVTDSGIIIGEEKSDNKKYVKHMGTVVYTNRQLKEEGINQGDTIVFSRFSEYEFEINGEILYKMSTGDIMAKIQ